MAAQTAPPEHIVCQGQRAGDRAGLDRNRRGRIKGIGGAKMMADQVGLLCQGKMHILAGPVHLLRMAGATGLRHETGMGGQGNQAAMGLFLVSDMVLAMVATGAGQLMVGVKLHLLVTAQASDHRRLGGGLGSGRRGGNRLMSGNRGLFLATTSQQNKNNEEDAQSMLHNLDTLP